MQLQHLHLSTARWPINGIHAHHPTSCLPELAQECPVDVVGGFGMSPDAAPNPVDVLEQIIGQLMPQHQIHPLGQQQVIQRGHHRDLIASSS
jgi:hypothetical protein